MRRALALTLTLIGCYHPPGPVAPLEPLTPAPISGGCEAAVARLLEGDPKLRAASAAIEVAAAERAVAGGWEAPELRLRGDLRGDPYSSSVALRWRLPRLGQSAAEGAAAEAGQRRVEAERAVLRVERAAWLRLAFIDAREAAAYEAHLQARRALAQARLEATRLAAKAGLTPGIQVASVESEVMEAEAAAEAAKAEAHAQRARLELWLGGASTLEACRPPTQGGLEAARHPSVLAAEAQLHAIHGQAFAARRAAQPWPETAEVTWAPDEEGDRLLLQVHVPLTWGGAEADLGEARIREARAQLDAVRHEVQAQARAARIEHEAQAARAERAHGLSEALRRRAEEIARLSPAALEGFTLRRKALEAAWRAEASGFELERRAVALSAHLGRAR